ncbi:endonuclease/exonuclease/phosphatase family protein [Actinocatenispora sera]|uniref:endonuclease/exonuclease/phosphatase family protein n=1 Tax=Actinocatenispora sera TaxID=390989 RepID=UPI0033E1EE5C
MSHPVTFTAMTYNLWGGWRFDERRDPLTELLTRRSPDLLATQELHPDSRAAVDAALADHDRVRDGFEGWATRSNLWWRRGLFDEIEHGAADVGIWSEHARLFWVRLACPAAGTELVFATAHLTWPGHPREIADDRSPRVEQSRAIVAELARLAGQGGSATGDAGPGRTAVLFTADTNDYARPLWTFYAGGYREPFGQLGMVAPATHPVYPLPLDKPRDWPDTYAAAKTIDWQFFRGPLRAAGAEVVEYFSGGVAPSDHKPVQCTYRFTS